MAFQINSMLLDACVLAVVMREDVYGYKLTQEVKEIMDVSESTLYPILRRLQKSGFLTYYDMSFQGRNRRYYTITPAGKIQFNYLYNQWNGFKNQINGIMDGGFQNGNK